MKIEDIIKLIEPDLEAAGNSPVELRRLVYAAIDRIPARWGTWGKIAFQLFARPKLRREADQWLARQGG